MIYSATYMQEENYDKVMSVLESLFPTFILTTIRFQENKYGCKSKK